MQKALFLYNPAAGRGRIARNVGGIVDIFSPAEERPVRLEFFGDEIDTMGYFDPVTQRRVENADELVILPVAETLPALHPGGIEGLARELDGLLARQRRRKTSL